MGAGGSEPMWTQDELKEIALKAIEKNRLIFIEDIAAFLPCSKRTMYNYRLQELQEVKEALYKNRVEIKSAMRSKWFNSDNATLQMGLMKLVGTEEERRRLSQTYQDVTSGGEVVKNVDWTKVPKDTLEALHDAILKEEEDETNE